MVITLVEFIEKLFSSWSFFIMAILLSGVIFANGFTDAPNSIATCVTTRTITPKGAILMSAVFNFFGIFIMSTINAKVAKTIFNIVDLGTNSETAVLALSAAMISIVSWAFLSGKLGIPTSESHALIAGLTGAAIALRGGFFAVNGYEWLKVFIGIVASIIGGFSVGFIFVKIVECIFRNFNRAKTKKFFRVSQILGGASMSFMHGSQAGQKFIGVFILGILLSNGITEVADFQIPIWLMVYCALLMTLGTSIGGYKIIKTVGSKVASLELYQGAVSDIATASCLLLASIFGIPVSTAHTKSLAIMGVGASRRLSNINWNIVKRIILAGIITFPCCGLFAFIVTKILLMIF